MLEFYHIFVIPVIPSWPNIIHFGSSFVGGGGNVVLFCFRQKYNTVYSNHKSRCKTLIFAMVFLV